MEEQSKIHRLLRMITMIQSRPGEWNAPRLAEALGVDIRTIYRDIKDLERAGLPCRHDREQNGYRAGEGVFLQPVHFSAQEALALAVLCDEVAGRGGIPYLAPACKAIEKLRSVLPIEVRGEIDAVMASVRVKTAAGADPREARDVYEKVAEAVRLRRPLVCSYESLSGASEFVFHPYALFFGVRAWYAIGMHMGHGEMRTLKLNRFASLSMGEGEFQTPAGFSVDGYLGKAWRMVRGEQEYEVELWFDPEFGPTVAETLWHETQEIEHHQDGSITYRCTVLGLDEIVWWVLSMGPHCVVRSPVELADRVKGLSQATASLYTGRRAD